MLIDEFVDGPEERRGHRCLPALQKFNKFPDGFLFTGCQRHDGFRKTLGIQVATSLRPSYYAARCSPRWKEKSAPAKSRSGWNNPVG